MKLTNRLIEAMSGPGPGSTAKAKEVSDSVVTGLRIICSAGTAQRKFFYFHYTFHGKRDKLKIGEFPAIGIEQARKQALAWRAAIDEEINPKEQRDHVRAMPTFSEYAMEKYLPYAKQHKSSWDMDESKLRLHLIPKFGSRRISDIALPDVEMYLGQIKSSHSPSTANRHLALLSKMFKLALSWKHIKHNPCLGIAKFKEPAGRTDSLSAEDLKKMLKAMDNEPNKQAVGALRLLLLTGTRREEALQSRWEHIDLDNARWFLPKTKNGKTRHVVLNPEAVELLRNHPRISGNPWVFPGRDPSRPLNNPRKAFTRILDAAGLPHLRIHSLRHVFASFAVSSGASLYQVQQLLGHASPNMTQRYAHLADDVLRQASSSVSSIYSQAKAGAEASSGA
ncbi:tyrosine-type recombinase/integrase [Pseudoduganella aquatica]|uniref:tyrosine-type recombinase/integrase n=1 Tax=Pseudoduganella aquatica TaxID=2660641 RepID=UPI001E3270C3|nr:site-specific integrase [Pseudoduganella aquatica]